ncbi:MAG: hypothetical protein WC877_00025 [Dehalococcoidales bacterium]
MYKYNTEYKHVLIDAKKEIDKIAKVHGTSFEYVIRDMYDLHYHDY